MEFAQPKNEFMGFPSLKSLHIGFHRSFKSLLRFGKAQETWHPYLQRDTKQEESRGFSDSDWLFVAQLLIEKRKMAQ